MKHLKILGLAAVAAMALMAIGASTASATTLAVGGSKTNSAVKIEASLETGTSAKLQKTDGTFANTCTTSKVVGTTSVFTGTAVSGPLAEKETGLSFGSCTTEKVTVDASGSLSVEWISGTTNGTVKSSGAKVTVPSPFGTLTCETGTGTDVGTLTGTKTGSATMDIKAVLNCGFLAPSATWEGSYWVTSPGGLGVEE
jgi:hypothetical protein